MVFYNEFDPFAAQWLRNLEAAGHIAGGTVDARDIREVQGADLDGYNQVHMFAGIGVWSYALRLAGWPDDREVWTGSCPCQPWSSAGKRGGADDPRHLWPEWFRLIRERRPAVIFGEQVASKDGLAWLDLVYADLEGAGYAVAAVDLCAASVGAPHIRQRLYFVAHAIGTGKQTFRSFQHQLDPERRGESFTLADTDGWNASAEREQRSWEHRQQPKDGGAGGSLAHTEHDGRRTDEPGRGTQGRTADRWPGGLGDAGGEGFPLCQCGELPGSNGDEEGRAVEQPGGAWSDIEWLTCRDGKARPTKPGIFPLADGAPGRVGRLRAYGNAIVGPLAAEFIRAYMETEG